MSDAEPIYNPYQEKAQLIQQEIDGGISQFRTLAETATERFKTEADYSALQQVHQTLADIMSDGVHSNKPRDFFKGATPDTMRKWVSGSYQVVTDMLDSVIPDVNKFYQEQIDRLGSATLSEDQLKQEVNGFQKSSMIMIIGGRPVLRVPDYNDRGFDITKEPLRNEEQPKLVETLRQTWTIQDKLGATLSSKLYRATHPTK